MGNFYVNYTVKGPSQEATAAALAGRRAAVSPTLNGCVVVFDELSDSQESGVLRALNERISTALSCPVLAVLNHDDDILCYCLHSEGKLVDEYDSNPGYFDFDSASSIDWEAMATGEGLKEVSGSLPSAPPPRGGDASALCRTLRSGEPSSVEEVLRASNGKYVFAFERHRALCGCLRLPTLAVGSGYASLVHGEFPTEVARDDIVFL